MTSNNRTIAIIDPLGSHVGHHYYVNNQAEALSAIGYDILIFGYNDAASQRQSCKVFNSFHNLYGSEARWRRGIRMITQLFVALVAARRRKAEFVLFHIFKYEYVELFAYSLSRLFGFKILSVIHDIERLDRNSAKGFSHFIVKSSHLVIVHNNFSKNALMAALGPALKNVIVAPHGNYISQFETPPSRSEARALLNLDPNQIILLFFGSSRPTKGLHLLLTALGGHRNERFNLLVAGTIKADYEQEMRKLISAEGLTDHVIIHNQRVNDDDVVNYYRAADIAVLPYTQVYESGVALMAMSLKRTILSSDLEPFKDAVGQDRGIIFSSGSPEALAEALDGIFDGRYDLKGMEQRAFEFARDSRSWHASASALDEAIKSNGAP